MNQLNAALNAYKLFFFARAGARGIFLFSWATVQSTGLIIIFCAFNAFSADFSPHTLDQALRSGNKNERLQASQAVQSGSTKATEKQLIQLRNAEKDGLVRRRMNQALAGAEMTGAAVAFIDSLEKDSDPFVRQGAAQSLGNYMQSRGAVEALAKALGRDTDKSVRCACALSLALSFSPISLSALEKAAQDPDADVRRQVAFSLQRHLQGPGKKKAAEILKKLRRDTDASVRDMASEPAR